MSIPPKEAAVIRFKGEVPIAVLLPHMFFYVSGYVIFHPSRFGDPL